MFRWDEEARDSDIVYIPLNEYKQGWHDRSQAEAEYGLGVRKWCVTDTGVPRMKAGEAAMTITNLCSNPKGKRDLAIP